MMAAKQISLKLMIHREKNQIVYAESGNDFVDVLLSFLTMPLGTVIRLTGKPSEMGSLHNLYGRMEDLDVRYLRTESCKNMLLYPKSASEEHCRNFMVNIDDTEPTNYYSCGAGIYPFHSSDYKHLISTFPDKNKNCRCGRSIDCRMPTGKSMNAGDDRKDGVFVKGQMRYMITDDLQISPVCMRTSLELLKRFGISHAAVLKEKNVNLGQEEVLHLLKRLLLSKTPLTDLFLPMQGTIDGVTLDPKVIELDSKDRADSHTENEIRNIKKMSVNLFVSKSRNKVLYAQVGEEFPDLLFSFLAFPLGSIVKCLGGCTSMGCLDDLYKSIEQLNKGWMKSEETKALLLDPKLAPSFGSMNQLIQINELPQKLTIFDCSVCLGSGNIGIADNRFGACSQVHRTIQVDVINPKFRDVVLELGGAFIAGPGMFMVTEELIVKPLSTISGVSLLSQLNIPICDLEEQVVSVGEEEALSLLKASLISKTVLSDVFLKKTKQLERISFAGDC